VRNHLNHAALSDRGRVREKNEDAWYADPELGLFIVSDGMGGHPGGELASRMVRDNLPHLIRVRTGRTGDLEEPQAGEIVCRSIVELSGLINGFGREKYGYQGMGATVVLALVRRDKALIAYLGDSRAYLYRAGDLTRLTRDHSIVQLLLDAGDITPQQAAAHPARGQITRFVGMEEEAMPEFRLIGLRPGDRLLLCSDGLTGMVDDAAIAAMMRKMANPEVICRHLVDSANEAGGQDNITVVLIDRVGPGGAPHETDPCDET